MVKIDEAFWQLGVVCIGILSTPALPSGGGKPALILVLLFTFSALENKLKGPTDKYMLLYMFHVYYYIY